MDVDVVPDEAESTRLSQARAQHMQHKKSMQRAQLQTLEVIVDMGGGAPRRVVAVAVDRTETSTKRYLGGYRHKQSGAVFHHAATQTQRVQAVEAAHAMRSRDSQTTTVKTRGVQNVREASTQMARADVLLDESRDRVVMPGAYVSAEERERCDIDRVTCISAGASCWDCRCHVPASLT